MEDLSTWLTVTNANIHEVLQTDNQQQAFIVLKSLEDFNKYQALLNQMRTEDSTNGLIHLEEQWHTLIEGSSELRKRYLSPESLLNSTENCLTFSRHLIHQQEQINSNTLSDNHQLLSQIQACEDELIYLKDLLGHQEKTSLLIDELTTFATSITLTRIQLEMRILQQQGLMIELESFTNWLQTFVNDSHEMTEQSIRLALSEREEHFHELTKCTEQNDLHIRKAMEQLIAMWSYLSSLVTDSPSLVSASLPGIVPQLPSLCIDNHQQNIIDQARVLLTTLVQLGNRQEIERVKSHIQTFLTHSKDLQLPDRLYDDLTDRQLILQQMLIDTCHIDRLRVNFVAHFNTENNAITAAHQLTTLIANYPEDMTSQLRQWFHEQQRTHPTTTGNLDHFEEYVKDLEESLQQYQQNDCQHIQSKKLIQRLENQPNLPRNVTSNEDKQRLESLQARFSTVQCHIEEIRKKHLSIKATVDHSISNINVLITRIKGFDDQIQHNAKQPVHDYDRLIFDCQRIITELDQNLRLPVEQALNTGKRLYIPDINRDSSGIESAEETGGGGSPLSSPLKTRSDLTLRKVRRHVLQLTQHWKNANNNIQHRLKLLQRVQTAAEEFRRKCDQLHAHLLEIELASVHKPQIKALIIEQIPAEIEQAKHLLTTLMSCKSAIDDLQQSAQTIEKEYDIQVVSRADELQHRWEHSVSSISQRIQSLQESVKNTDSDIYSISVEYPWQRAIALNQIPYYINHSDQTTSWDHPKMLELMRSFSNYNHIRFSAYRTAMKLRTLQKRLCLDLTSLGDIRSIFEEFPIDDVSNKTIDIKQILDYLQRIFDKTSHEYPQLVHVMSTVDLTLNWLLNIYDTNRTGTIRLLSVKMALALLCRGNIEEKYRYIFSLLSYENNSQQVLDRQRLAILFQQAIVIPKQLGEVAAFGGSSVEPSVQSCFEYAHNPDVINIDDFLQWVKLEPQSLVWLPVMHRLAASEAAKHEARCNICKIYPMLGFRYRSLRHFNCDICQNCFFSGKQTKVFKMDHPLQEYYSETTSTEDIRDFFRIFKNKLWNRQRKHPKLGYLPLPYVFDSTISTTDQPSSPTPIVLSSLTTPFKSESEPSRTICSSLQSDDEHGIIAQHCKNLNTATYKSPRTVAHALLNQSTSLNTSQRHELEAIIHDLEDENHLLQNEYERLCQEHMEKSLIINEHHEQLQLNESSSVDLYQDRTMLREAKQLRQHQSKLEQRMIILEEHNKQLEKQLQRSKQLLIQESPTHKLHHSTDRQTNLMTIDNLFHMADDINRAVGDLVSVITEPQTTSTYKD